MTESHGSIPPMPRRMRPVNTGGNAAHKLLEDELEQLCVSPKTPLLQTRIIDNAWVCGPSTHHESIIPSTHPRDPSESGGAGDNRAGQLGLQPRGPILSAAPIKGAVRWASVALSANHSIAIAADGKVYCWGLNNQGQLGRGHASDNVADPEPVLSTFELDELSVVAVGAGTNHSIVAAGDALFVWGNNQYGQLGCGEVHDKPVCAPMMLRWLENVTVTQLTCGNNHSIVVTNQSTVYAWGCNERGQLGLGDQKLRSRPVRVDRLWGIPIVNVAAGGEHSLAVTTNGMLFTWGSNSHGQLGHPYNVEEAEEVHKRRSASVRAHARAKLNQRFMNSLVEMGFPKAKAELALLETGNSNVEVAIEWLLQAANNKEKESQAAKDWDMVNESRDPPVAPSVGLTSEDLHMSTVPKRVVQLSDIIAVAAGTNHTVVTCNRGVYTFGCNDHGQLGLGSLQDAPVPVRVKHLANNRDRIVQVAAGLAHTLFISESNRVFAAGLCDLGQFKPTPTPSPLAGTSGSAGTSVIGATSSSPVPGTPEAPIVAAAAVAGSFHALPVRVHLPFMSGTTDGNAPKPILHEAKAGGHASVFLIRAPDEPVQEPPISLIDHLENILEHAESEVQSAIDTGTVETSKPSCFKHMRACIGMVYSNATALCAAFGLPTTPNYAKKLDDITARVLNLYNPENVPRIAEELEKSNAHYLPHLQKRMRDWHGEIKEDMKKAFVKIVEDIQAHVKQLAISERAMLLLFSAQHPCLEEHAFAQVVLPKLCHSVLSAATISQQLLVRWWSTYPKDILAERVVRPLQSYITMELQATKKLTLAVMNSIKVLAKVEEASMVHLLLPPEVFYNQLISDKMDMQDHYLAWRQSHNNDHRSPAGMGPFSFCSFPFLLNAKAKTRLLQVEAKMQMEQTVAEARLEQVYQHYKKSRTQLESELVALTSKDRLRIELLKQENEEKKERKERSPGGGVGRFVGWFRGRSARGSASTAGGAGPSHPGGGSRPGSSPGLPGPAHSLSLSIGGSTSSGGNGSSHGEPATEAERRMAAREISADNLSLPRAASLQLPAPVNCQFRDRHPDMCVVRVRRNHLVEDAMDEISRQLKKDLFKPLRVHFIGEEGIDAGGVKKEFFQLLVTELLCPDYGMLTFHAESRTYWFNHWSSAHALPDGDGEQSLTDYRLLGVVLGLAIYNNVLLDFPLPIALYRKICGHEVGLSDLEDFQPTIGKSLRQLLEYTGPGSVKDTFCQVFAIDEEAAGEHRTVELIPDGSNIDVTEENRRDFVDQYVNYVLNTSIEKQYAAFFEGLMMLCKGPAITLFSPVEMERLVCGNPHLDFKALESAAKYEAGFSNTTPAVVWLWDIAQNVFDLSEKRMFLKFFTGSDRAPIGGLGSMKCIIQRDGPDSNKLPTSHTCFNTLLLPEYASREKMMDRLKLAIMNSEGFGLE